jgi:tetratricopeptide (TPR) repeat protein
MEDQLDQIEKYLSGELSKEATETFEAHIGENDELRNQVENHRRFLRGLELGFNRELKAQLRQEEQRITGQDEKNKRRAIPTQFYFGIAAAIALILISVFLLRTQSSNTTEYFVTYYQPYPNIENPVSRSENSGQNAYAYYEQGQYSEALNLFSQIIMENPAIPAPVFYSGICQLELGETVTAIALFKQVQAMEKNSYSRAALWYEALANLKISEKSRAVEILTGIAEGDDNYAIRSKELLGKLGD